MLCGIGWDYAMCIVARVGWKRMVLANFCDCRYG